MNIHEYQASGLFRAAGIPVSSGDVAVTSDEAKKIAGRLGFPVVLKAQVLTGGRGKAGGIKVVKDELELVKQFTAIKNLTIKGYAVERIFVVKVLDIRKEFYLAITVDAVKGDAVVIASSAGGVDIEETAKTEPEQIHKFYLERKTQVDMKCWAEFRKGIFKDEKMGKQVDPVLQAMVKLFFEKDCSLVEINPLVIDGQGKLIAADAKVNFDDNALFRHPDIQELRDMKYEDTDELEAKENGLSFVKLDGKVGCIVNGAGLAMATLDVIKLLGGEPANFLDVGGSSNPEKVLNALKIILRNKKTKSILINIFGGITRCDDIANGLIEARKQLKFDIPLVVRLTGTNEKEAKEILAKAGISTFPTMREGVQQAVKLAK